VILSLITLILPHFLYLSVATLILLSSAFVGLLITITDLTTLLHSHYNQLRITIKRYGDDLIIDDVLKDLFGPEGWLSFAVGSWIGTVFLYFLPLSKELRWRIIRQAWGEDQDDYIRAVLFQPGGIWKINPSLIIEEEVDGDGDCDLATPVKMGDIRGEGTAENECDMTWDDADTETETTSTRPHTDMIQLDSHEHDSIEALESVTNLSVRAAVAATSLVENGMEETNNGTRTSGMDEDAIGRICLDVIRQMSKSVLGSSNVPGIQFQRIGAVAAIMLGLQMKYSRVARQTMWNVAQGTAACSLASVAIGALGSARFKKQLMQFVYGEEIHSTRLRVHRSPRVIDGLLTLNGAGGGTIGGIRNCVESLLCRFRNDAKFKRKWQGFFALFVLCCVRRGRSRARILSGRQ